MKNAQCPLCRQRRAKRRCPALSRDICPVCCGTKRLTEIRCPPDCTYLASARTHPPAAVRQQQERDVEFLLPLVRTLTPEQSRLFLEVQALVRRAAPAALPPLRDRDVADAANALAATFETAVKGIIYEHRVDSLPAQRLVADLRAGLEETERAERLSDGDAAVVLRRIAQAAAGAAAALPGGDDAYLRFVERMMREPADGETGAGPAREAPRIIL